MQCIHRNCLAAQPSRTVQAPAPIHRLLTLAELASEVDELQVHPVPALRRESGLEGCLHTRHLAAGSHQAPADGQAVDVRVHCEGGDAEGLGHDAAGRLVADAGERLELLDTARHAAAKVGEQPACTCDERFLAFVGASPSGRMISKTSACAIWAMACGVGHLANSVRVTSFTLPSVLCALSMTAHSRV